MRTLAIVLAGGQSRRMGRDKLALPRDGLSAQTVLHHAVEVAMQAADDVIVAASPDGRPELENVQILTDPAFYRGPLHALAHVWQQLDLTDVDGIFVVAGDLPGITAEVLVQLRQVFMKENAMDGVLVKQSGKLQPLIGMYKPTVRQVWTTAVNNHQTRLMDVVMGLRINTIDADAMNWPKWWTRPVHTPEDYARWLQDCARGSDEARDLT